MAALIHMTSDKIIFKCDSGFHT